MSRSPKTLMRRLTWTLWVLALLMAVLVIAVRMKPAPPEGPALPIIAEVPDFALTHHDGTSIRTKDLLGKPWVADFVFTRCPGVCPIMTQRMKELTIDLAPGLARYVSISVDPEHDTPEVLKVYAQKHEAGPDWYFLTGAESEIYPLIRQGFMLALDASPANPAEGTEPIVHSNRFVLVDAEGRIRGYYNSFNAEELAQLRVDVARLGA